ncbi:MAG: hypothetical protein HQ528_11550 [Candidatus Marinimicrobia bacterium]|nr:hypothetical protein [Candidatus Neomarinimicrobiota bacterium]
MSKKSFFKSYRKILILWLGILIAVIIALLLGVDEKIVVFGTLVVGLFTQAFAGLATLIVMIPLAGPLIVKVLTIPFFWILNALAYLVSVLAIRKGYGKDIVNSRVITLALLVGTVIGYILGHLLPLR